MSRMSKSSILDSVEVCKQEIFMFNPNPFLATFSRNLFSGLFYQVQILVYIKHENFLFAHLKTV